MVRFKKNVKDTKLYAWETTWFVAKVYIAIGIVCIPLIIYQFVIGIFIDKDALGYGVTLLILLVIIILIIIRMYFYYKKNLNLYFRDADSNGDVEGTVSAGDDEYVMENLSGKSVCRLRKNDITKTKVTKNCLFIKTNANVVIFFPKTDEILDLFGMKESTVSK